MINSEFDLTNISRTNVSCFDFCEYFDENLILVYLNGCVGLIDFKGNEIIKPVYDSLEKYDDSIIKVEQNKKFGLINANGEFLTENFYNYIGELKNNVAKIELDGNFGYINRLGIEIVKPIYYRVREFSENIVAVNYKGDWGFVDINGNIITNTIYDRVGDFGDGVAVVRKDRKIGLIDSSGKLVVDYNKYFEIKKVSCDYALVKTNNSKYGFIDRFGSEKIAPIYDKAYSFVNDIAWVKCNDKYGLIDKEENCVVSPMYDSVEFKYDFTIVSKDCCAGLFDNNGNLILPTIYKEIYFLSNEYICVDGFVYCLNDILKKDSYVKKIKKINNSSI